MVTDTGSFTHEQLAAFAARYGTPLYVYDGDLIAARFQRLRRAYEHYHPRVKVYYAFKANTNMSIVALLRGLGANGECISMGELMLAERLGFAGEDLLFTSNSKSPQELAYAVQVGAVINLDSLGDLENLIAVAERFQQRVRVSFRINTDVDPDTHRHIATSHKTTKFGIMPDEILAAYRRAHAMPLLDVWGMHSHIGSQILDLGAFVRNIETMLATTRVLARELGIQLKFLNPGGGLGVPYRDGEAALNPEDVALEVCARVTAAEAELGFPLALWLEPGRYFVGPSGMLLARVNSVKKTAHRNFINVDTGFNHLVRPVLYEAYHRVRVLGRHEHPEVFDVAGNICETGDVLAHERLLPTPEVGDLVAFLDAGAYGFSMASEFNMFPLPAELLVRGGKEELIRTRGTMDDMLRNQILLTDL